MKRDRSFYRQLSLAILILLIALLVSTCSKPVPELIPIGDAKVIAKLENGNFEVTPAFVKTFRELAVKVRLLELKLEKCREKGSQE